MFKKLLLSLWSRLLISFGIGIFVVVGTTVGFMHLAERRLDVADEIGVLAFQIAAVSLPFVILSLLGAKSVGPWLIGLGMTAAFWGFYSLDAWLTMGSGTGANIGLGLLMLVSPLIISTACVVAMKRAEERARSAGSAE